MSSFMVSTDCMSYIINGLFWNHGFKNFISTSILDQQNLHEYKDFRNLADRLFEMNQKALLQRYDDKPDSDYVKIPKFEINDKPVSDLQLLKSLQCLSYQCCEGNVPKTKLYKWVETIIESLKSYIISKMPEYDKAKWS